MAEPAIVTAAFPFVPAVLGTAHAASTYVPADVTARLLRMLGRRAALASAMDVHSVQLSRDGIGRDGVEQACDAAEARYRAFFSAWGVTLDLWFRTDASDHVERTRATFARLAEANALLELERAVELCSGCGAAVPPRLAVAGTCPWCGGAPATAGRPHFHLAVEPRRDAVAASSSRLPGAARGWLSGLLGAPLAPWCLTRDNRVGIGFEEGPRSLYIWFDSLVGYLTIRARLGADFDRAEMLQFFGKNILYHHAAIQPALLAALGETLDWRASVRGFLGTPIELAGGGVGARDARRLYLIFKTFDAPRDFQLSEAECTAFVRERVIGRLGNLLRRCGLQAQRGPIDAGEGRALIGARIAALQPVLERHAALGEPRLALLAVLDEAKRLTAEGQSERWLIDDSDTARGKAAGALALLLTLLTPFAPDALEAFAVFEGWSPGPLAETGTALGRPLVPRPMRWPD